MLLFLCVLLTFFHCYLSEDITYHVKEESIPYTYVGDIATDLQTSDSSFLKNKDLITFSQLQQKGEQLFNVTKRGKLYTVQTLDAESVCSYEKECFEIVKVAVHKSNTIMMTLIIKVIIEDINDHQPEFPKKEITLYFMEGDGKGVKEPIPNAIDKDVGHQNSLITYELKDDNGHFSLSVVKQADGISTLEIILKEKLDREKKDSYNIEVIAKDGGTPPKQCVLNVKISVEDVNDNTPQFSQSIYNVSIEHGHKKNIPVVTLSANDLDISRNGKIFFYFGQKTDKKTRKHFNLVEKTGQIFLRERILPGKKEYFKLYIEARDGGTPHLSSIATVMVNVINHHNNPPTIDIDFVSAINDTATIYEDIKVGSFIAYVMVTDNDVGHNGQVICHIKHDILELQSMGSKEYKIVLKKAVDRETQEHYHFTVSCQDKGLPPLKTDKDLSMQVLDVNDVEPHFTKDTFKFLTYENDKANFPIGFINATDPDVGKGGELTYYLRNKHQYRLPFQIINSGFISTNQSLDREHREFYDFQVFVKDNGTPSLNNTVNVEVKVLDRNDNAPYFTFPSVDPFTLDVHYHPQSKNDITLLKASDRDSHMNAFLMYEIVSGNERQLFKLDSFTGVLSYSRRVYQNDTESYQLEFVVKDSGTPVLSATTSVSLTLTVSNKIYSNFNNAASTKLKSMNLTMIIIIVVACVIISLVIIISITVCVFRCIQVKQNSITKSIPSITEMNDYYNQIGSKSTSTTANIYWETVPEMNKDKFSSFSGFQTVPRSFLTMRSEEMNPTAVPQYLSHTLGYRNSGDCSRKQEVNHYEEIQEI